jgi:hypothetical protein
MEQSWSSEPVCWVDQETCKCGTQRFISMSLFPVTVLCPKSDELSPYTLSCWCSFLILSTLVWPSLRWSLSFSISCYNSVCISKLACVFAMPHLPYSPSFYLHTKQHLNFIGLALCSVKLCTYSLTISYVYPISVLPKIAHHWIWESPHCFWIKCLFSHAPFKMAWHVLHLQREEKVSGCEWYWSVFWIAVLDSWQEVILQLGVWVRGWQQLSVKT